ncbi:hypothetical protein [Lacticaseibacillus saniviri]|uniref:Uncharacterized protein n=2 Tax=Lacticaseibacillus saniviri TaxID=931533 RepID=A0A0R2MRS3_9LACO|nr:hypothetical protein [Lacticaseibacillus saniviri]KRO16293.1 hypothetical protein IV56_GL001654 [Lacticaseibacillus saniviri JCM 17471 = DSM 24301]MCG4281860.1 hypothetical protein [Lacticaseibacillus saniviri]
MLDIQGSLDQLAWNTQHHYAHIEAQHEFIRIWAVQFELGYSDMRMIQLALQLDKQDALLAKFTAAYQAVYAYEYAFAADGLEGFNAKFGNDMPAYKTAATNLLDVIDEIRALKD